MKSNYFIEYHKGAGYGVFERMDKGQELIACYPDKQAAECVMADLQAYEYEYGL